MATIKEDFVSFETAKLLKEKGFDVPCLAHWFIGSEAYEKFSDYPFNWNELKSDLDWLSHPTLQMTMKWLREVYKIHIIAEPCLGEGNEPNLSFNRWFWTVLKEEWEYKPIRKIDEFSTYEQACEAAVKYCLENLI